MSRRRIDQLLVERSLVTDLKEARARILAGEVIAGEHRIDKVGTLIKSDAPLRIKTRRAHGFVSRGGLKLEAALAHIPLPGRACICVDLGASTGGFTDCLLKNGAARVYAVDVAYGVLDWSLQKNPKVINLERRHAAQLTDVDIPESVDVLVADISFNSLSRLLPHVLVFLKPQAQAYLLLKPQFEAEPHLVEAGGVLRDEVVREKVVARTTAEIKALGFKIQACLESPIRGATGNVEYLLIAQRDAHPVNGDDQESI